MTTLNDFLRKCSIAKDDKTTKPTHTRIGNKDAGIYGGSFHIPPEKSKLFHTLYYNEVINGKREECLTEKQLDNGKFYIDLDFRYCYDDITERQHDKNTIQNFISIICDEAKKLLDFDKPFMVYVMEKDNINQLEDKTMTKDGIHMLFDFEVNGKLASVIRSKVIQYIKSDDTIQLPLLNSWESVFDEGIVKRTTNCQLFGSKKPLHDAYKLTYIYELELDKSDNEFMIVEQHDKTITKELFLSLCVRTSGIQFPYKQNTQSIIDLFNKKPDKKTANILTNTITTITTNEEPNTEIYSWFKKALEYDMFDKIIKKCGGDLGRQIWFRLAFLLKDDVGEHGEDMFVALSKSHDKFDEDKVRELYKKLSEYPKPDKPMTIATLKKLYKEVDNESYELINDYFKNIKKQNNGLKKGELCDELQKIIDNKNTEQIKKADETKFDVKELEIFNNEYFMSFKDYPTQKKYFEHFVCMVMRPEPIYIYCEKETNISKDVCMYSQNKIIETFRHLKFIEPIIKGDMVVDVEKPFINKWIDDDKKRTFHRADFMPYGANKKVPENIYNLFRGFNPDCKAKYDKLKKEQLLKPFKDLWLQLCGGVPEHFNYFYKSIAQMIQEPNKKIPICYIIKGPQGTGKNVGLKAIANLIGRQHYITSSNPKDFFGDYAEGFVNKLLVNLNECEGKDTFDFEGKIKSFITEDTITLNQKYLRPFEILNLARVFITTNKNNPIPIDVKSGDRRYVVFLTTCYYLDAKYGSKFWERLIKHFERPDFIACLYDDLMSIDISGINWKGERPITEAYLEMCKLYVPVEVLFFEHYCVNNKITPNHLATNVYNDSIDCDIEGVELYNLFNEFCSKFKFNRTGERNIKSFYGRIVELEIPTTITKPHNIKTYHFNTHTVLSYFKQKKWIDKDDEDIINIAQDTTGEDFDELFDI
jgi:hypothetical protein